MKLLRVSEEMILELSIKLAAFTIKKKYYIQAKKLFSLWLFGVFKIYFEEVVTLKE